MALMKSAGRTRAGSNSTVAVLVARLTLARVTPLVAVSVRSMVRAQAAQVMPETGRSTRSAVFMWRTHSCVPRRHSCRRSTGRSPTGLSTRYLVAQLPHRVGQPFGCHHLPVVLHGGFRAAQIHRRFRHAPRAGQFPLHATRAVSASHAMDGKAQGLNRHTYMMSHVRQMDAMTFRDAALARRLEAAEAANAKGCTAWPPGSAVLDVGGGCAIFVGAGSPLSQAVGIGLNGPVGAPDLDRLAAFFLTPAAA